MNDEKLEDFAAGGDNCILAFFTRNDSFEHKITCLTLAEAEWIATVLQKNHGFEVDRKIGDAA